jgi:hypothetical protein
MSEVRRSVGTAAVRARPVLVERDERTARRNERHEHREGGQPEDFAHGPIVSTNVPPNWHGKPRTEIASADEHSSQ